MKKEEAVANAMAVFAYAELRQIGHIRTFCDYELEVSITIHFKTIGEEIYNARHAIYPLLMDGTTIEEHSYPNRGYECLDLTWSIEDEKEPGNNI